MDFTVVKEEIVGDVGETMERFLIVIGDGFVAHIAARHHQRLERTLQQKVVKRRVGEHRTEGFLIRGDRTGNWRALLPSQNDNGPLDPQQ